MNNITENIKSYFSKKEKGDTQKNAPEGMCPNCWGRNEWESEYYELKKDKHLIPGNNIYNSFISKIVDKHIATTHKHGDKYICTTCNKSI